MIFLKQLFVLLVAMLLCQAASAITYYTYTNGGSAGDWDQPNTWTTDPSGGTLIGSTVPSNNDYVVILNGYTVNLTANVANTGLNITINSGGTLDLQQYTFTQTVVSLNGFGILRIKSANFPSITTNNFSNNSSALVEFMDFSGSLPVINTYPNVRFVNNTDIDHTITLANPSGYTLNIRGSFTTVRNGTGSLTVNLGSSSGNNINCSVYGTMNIGAGTKIGVGEFNSSHRLTFYGNVINNGTIDFSNNDQYSNQNKGVIDITFAGATNNSFTCNGITDLNTLTVDKGVGSDFVLHVLSNDPNNVRFFSRNQLITVTQGVLRLGNNINMDRLYGSGSSNYDIGSETRTPMLWIDGAIIDANKSPFVVYGKFRITAGSFTSIGGEGGVIREDGQYIIEGGTVTLEKFRPSLTASTHRGSFIMTGGVFNANGTGSSSNYARFSHPYPEQVFIMSGGIINVSNPQNNGDADKGGIHIGVNPSNYSVTGGTFNAILSGSADEFKISSTVPFYNLNISRTGGPTTVVLQGIGKVSGSVTSAQPLTVLNSLNIDDSNSPKLDPKTLDVTLKGNFTIGDGAEYLGNTNNTIFNGSGDQIFNLGNNTIALKQLTVSKPSGTLTLSGASTSLNVTNLLQLLGGVLNDGGKTIYVSGNILNSAVHTGIGNITLNGSATQTLSGNGNGICGNLVLNNSSNPGARFVSDQTVSGSLTLAGTTSILDIDIYRLSLTSTLPTALSATGDPFGSNKMIRTSGRQSDGGIRKTYGNLSPFTFACGTPNGFTPVTIQFNSAPTTYGEITMKPVSTRHPFVKVGNTRNLTHYWKINSSGISGINSNDISIYFNYPESMVSPSGDDVAYVPARYHSTSWNTINDLSKVDETNNRILFENIDYIDGEYTAGELPAFVEVKTFYSIRNGDWNNTTPGTTPWSNIGHSGLEANSVPGPNDQVIIGDGNLYNHTITVNTNGQNAGALIINNGSILDLTTSTNHNFGVLPNTQVLGSGKLRISSSSAVAEFPGGDFGNFIRSAGGTVEYYSTGSNFTIPKASRAPSNLPLITYKHIVLTPLNSNIITLPDQDLTIYGNMTCQGTQTTDRVELNKTSAKKLTVNGNLLVGGGRLAFQNDAAQSIEILGNVTVGVGAVFSVNNSGSAVANNITLWGNLVNNGILDFFDNNRYCSVIFNGSNNVSITGSGSVTDFHSLTVSKGSNQDPILNVNSMAFTFSGNTAPLKIESGTFRLTSTQDLTISVDLDFVIPSTGRLSANGGTFRLSGQDETNLMLNGTLEILNGEVYVGTTAHDNNIEYASTGRPTITIRGGNLHVQSQIRRPIMSVQGALVYDQSGESNVYVAKSKAPVNSRGVFEILNSGSSFSMSGGNLRILRSGNSSSIADVYLYPTSSNVTSGTLEIGNGPVSQTVDINTTIPLHNLTISGSNNTARLETNPLTLKGSLSINCSDCKFNANSKNVSIAGNFTNINTENTPGIGVGGFVAGAISQTTTFNGTNNHQTLIGTNGNLTNFANLVINNTFANGSINLQANTNIRVNNSLALNNGTLTDGENSIFVLGTVQNSSRHTSLSGSGGINLIGASTQTISGNGSGVFGNLVLNNNNGAVFTSDQEITGLLTFSSGSLWIGSHRLFLNSDNLNQIIGATSSKYIISSGLNSDGGVTKKIGGSLTDGSFTFPIGVAGKFTPVNYIINTGTSGGNLNVVPVNSKHPGATGPGFSYLNYYWNVTSNITNLISAIHAYTYSNADVSGTETDFRDARYISGSWNIGSTTGNPDASLNVITFNNSDLTGGYTAGEPSAFVNSIIYRSIGSGNWESDLTVWDVDPPGSNLGPPSGSIVIINEGHIINVTNNSKSLTSLEVKGSLLLGNTVGHNFGTVTASGTGGKLIQLSSSTFPGGNFSAFVASGGGTIEYNGSVTLPVQSTYNNLSFSGIGDKILANVDLTLNGNLTIESGRVINSVNNRNISLTGNNADFINNGEFVLGNGSLNIGRNLLNNGIGSIFNSGSGSGGIRVDGGITNSNNASFNMGTDNLVVGGNITNEALFVGNSGDIDITGNFNNSLGGTFLGGSGKVLVNGNLNNNAVFTASSSETMVMNNFSNSGNSALFNLGSGNLNLNNNFTNDANAVFNGNSGILNISGNWTNNATFNQGTSTVNFITNTNKSVTGVSNYYNLTKSGNATLVLNNNVSIDNTLSLTNGKIRTGSNNILLKNNSSQPITGYSSNNFIDGALSIEFPNSAGTSRIFPVGKGNIYRPVTITQTMLSVNPSIKVEMINTPPSGDIESSLAKISEARYYKIDLISGTQNSPQIELSFNNNGSVDEPVVNAGNLKVARSLSPAGPWTDVGGSGVFSPVAPAGYVTSGTTAIASETYFSIGFTEQALPITLLSFSGRLIENQVNLKWSTATEKDNDYFTIERSSDIVHFDSLFSVAGAGNSKSILHYEVNDILPLVGLSYYRLKQTDYNGNFSYSEPISILNTNDILFKVSPNPIKKNEPIVVDIEGAKTGQQMHLFLFDIRGIELYSEKITSSGPHQKFNIEPHILLNEGVYILVIQTELKSRSCKLLLK